MLCDICAKKKATVHLTEIVDEQMSEMHLCEDCAHTKSAQMEQQFGLADLLAGLSDFGKQVKDAPQVKLECTGCGLSYDDFKKFGRLGCSECFTSFHEQMGVLLKKIHGSNRHLGKTPAGFVPTAASSTASPNAGTSPAVATTTVPTLADLRQQLQQAIMDEDFERAALLRDKIREMERDNP